MLGLILVVLLVAAGCGAFFYWLIRHGLATEESENPQDRRRVSLLTESVAYFGATLVLAGGGVAVGQEWRHLTAWSHVAIFGSAASLFLATGLVVLWVTEPAIQRMIGVVWFLSAGCAGAAAGIAAHDVSGSSGATTALVTGIVIMLYSAILWLVRRRELQLVAMFAGLTITVCAAIIAIAGSAGPWLAVALGLWALGIGWVTVGWQYPQPLWSTVPLGTVIALIGPSFAVWSHGWVYLIGIATAAAAMAVSIRLRTTTLLAAGTLALFGYLTSAVVRYFHQSIGLPATLAVCGVLLLALAVIMARMRRGTAAELEPGEPELAEPELAEPEPGEPELAEPEPGERQIAERQAGEAQAGQDEPDPSQSPVTQLARAS